MRWNIKPGAEYAGSVQLESKHEQQRGGGGPTQAGLPAKTPPISSDRQPQPQTLDASDHFMDLTPKSCVLQAPRKTIAAAAKFHQPTDILPSGMSHVTNDRKLLSRIRRIKGQIEGLERAVLQGEDCYKVLQQTAAARGALNGLVAELIETHLRFHTLSKRPNRNGARELDQVMTVIRSYLG